MPEDQISVIDLAAQHGLRKQTLFKVLRRNGIEPRKRLGANSRGQAIAYITSDEARTVVDSLRARQTAKKQNEQDSAADSDALLCEQGVFYLLLLEPKSDPGRFKMGFATSLPERLRQLRCSAPFVEVWATWKCKRLWEKTAIECVANGCEQLHTEVFRTSSLSSVREKCERFFDLIPKLG